MTDGDPVVMRALDTARLRLEPQVGAHAVEMFAVLSDPAIYEVENAPPASLEWLHERYRKLESRRSPDGRQLWLNWVARLRADDRAIGYVQATRLHTGDALIAYEFGSAWWGRGLATEAVGATVDHLRLTWSVGRVGAVFKRSNGRSRRLLQRLGMRPAAIGEFPALLAADDEAAMLLER